MAGSTTSWYHRHKNDPGRRAAWTAKGNEWRRNLSPERRKERNRKLDLKKNYGITVTQYEAMKEAQGGKCAICREVPIRSATREGFCVDHDHVTGKIRGLLCWLCNHAIERVEKQSDWGQRAVKYLEGVK